MVRQVSQEVAWQERAPGTAADPAALAEFLSAQGERIDAAEFPRSRELLELALTADRDTGFHAGLDAILTGFEPGT